MTFSPFRNHCFSVSRNPQRFSSKSLNSLVSMVVVCGACGTVGDLGHPYQYLLGYRNTSPMVPKYQTHQSVYPSPQPSPPSRSPSLFTSLCPLFPYWFYTLCIIFIEVNWRKAADSVTRVTLRQSSPAMGIFVTL